MIFTLFLLVVVLVILVLSLMNKFDKIRTQLDQVNRRTVTLSEVLQDIQQKINALKTSDLTSSSTVIETDPDRVIQPELEEERVVVPPPIPTPVVEENVAITSSDTIIETYASDLDHVNQKSVDLSLNNQAVEERVAKEEEIQATVPSFAAPQAVDHFSKEEEESKFVKGLKEVNWLNAIGIITLVLGIGFFVKYAIDQDWINEVGRVALGIAVGGILVGIAHKLSVKYRVFSSILLGGGFATFYTTITLAFREYEIFNQTTAFVILIVITVLAVLLSLAYKRQEVAIFAFIGGMLSPLLISTGSGNHIVLFSYILLLNTGVLIVAVRQRWLLIDKFSYVLTFLYLGTWLWVKYQEVNQGAAILFTALFFLQFMLLLVLRYKNKTEDQSPWGQLLYMALTNFTALICFFAIHAKSTGVNYLGVIIIGMALVNALFILSTTRGKSQSLDKNFTYTLLAITIGLVSLAIPVQLSKVYITIVWAIEMGVLFWIWTRTRANLFRVGALLLSVLTVFSYLIDIRSFSPTFEYQEATESTVLAHLLPIIVNQYTLTGIVMLIAFLFVYQCAKKSQLEEEDTIGLKSITQPTTGEIQKGLRIVLFVLAYIILFLELSYQVGGRIEYPIIGETNGIYKTLALVTYSLLFGAVYFALDKHKTTKVGYLIYVSLTSILLLVFAFSIEEVRSDIFNYSVYPKGYFTLHLLSFAVLLYLYWMLYRNLSQVKVSAIQGLNAVLFISLVVLFSVELDNMMIWILSIPETYYTILDHVHAYGYPILWGLMAMILMILGINKEKAEWRKLSLVSFGIIILKFYLYDVWRMNQGGKIASFVVLGIILLIVSFLLERIKLLLKDKEDQTPNLPKEDESSDV
ncbi:DUF2339 domain-containing protein [Myroides sp. WP-1]|uniref:DUF2339 domain-containing protein n=1 Tax=Myroides sp. WP-1 TaxID=2759944 RepID=UPI0015FD197E|nr:DUF2339 domain-containing protein [Myroides sp. WP-1]MBB1139816.1 DUF2339 domain-containing protein [Myroides sp. WP-1]